MSKGNTSATQLVAEQEALKQPVVADPDKGIPGEFVKDLVKLRLPATATALVGTVVGLADPVGLHLGPEAPALTGAVVIVGVIAYYVQSLRARAAAARP